MEAPPVKPVSAEQQLEEIERATGAINGYNLLMFKISLSSIYYTHTHIYIYIYIYVFIY